MNTRRPSPKDCFLMRVLLIMEDASYPVFRKQETLPKRESMVRLLLVEDDEADAELLTLMLPMKGFPCEVRQVETAEELSSALDEFSPQVIVCDFSMPKLDGFDALALAQGKLPTVPFFFFSGSVNPRMTHLALERGASGCAQKGDFVGLLALLATRLRSD